jgi:DNA-binding NtrC family response regulator
MSAQGKHHAPFETTAPASSVAPAASSRAPLGILWVFPEPANLVTLSTRPRQIVGRGEDCDVRLAGRDVSRRHALLIRDGDSWFVCDLASRNGVHVDGERVTQAELRGGSVLRVGDAVGVVRAVGWQPDGGEGFCRRLARDLVGGPLLAELLEPVRRAAKSDLPIVIEGETGTGKECVARAIHEWSGRTGPFVGVNCAALPESLAESELFGHRKGAFTGADRNRVGHLQAAQGGTLLLDEVTDLPLSVQPKLLRALELREVVPLGDSTPVPIEVRLVTASQESLRRAAEQKRFRADLYARLSGMVVALPPLRDRTEEVPTLFGHMLARHAGGPMPALDARLVEWLCLHDWPFNVRELDLLARRLLALHGEEPALRRSHLPPDMLEPRARASHSQPSDCQSEPARRELSQRAQDFQQLVEIRRREELEALGLALRAEGGNVARAARQVGISRQRAYRLMEGLIDPDELREGEPGPRGNRSST